MKTFELKGSVRGELGKKATKAIRKAEGVPCALYGEGENINFCVAMSDVRKLIYTPQVYLVEIELDGKKHKAIIKELQFAPVSERLLHIDFLAVNDEKPIVVALPVKLTGLAEGVKAGGKLSQEMRMLKIKGIYSDMPEQIEIDVTNLGLGKRIQVSDIKLDKLSIVNPHDAMVARVKMTRAAAAAAAAN